MERVLRRCLSDAGAWGVRGVQGVLVCRGAGVGVFYSSNRNTRRL